MNINDLIQDAKNAPRPVQIFYQKAFDISDRVHSLLEKQGKSQKDLALALGKSESEISKWLSGQHNLTLRSLAAVEAALGEAVIITPDQCRANEQPEAEKFTGIGELLISTIQCGSMVVGPDGLKLSRRFQSRETRKIAMTKPALHRSENNPRQPFPFA